MKHIIVDNSIHKFAIVEKFKEEKMLKDNKKIKQQKMLQLVADISKTNLFPVFSDIRRMKPLKIGFRKEFYSILKENPNLGISITQAKKFLCWYTTRKRYYLSCVKLKKRFGLDGVSNVPMSKENLDYYNGLLQNIPVTPKKPFEKKGVIVEFKKKRSFHVDKKTKMSL